MRRGLAVALAVAALAAGARAQEGPTPALRLSVEETTSTGVEFQGTGSRDRGSKVVPFDLWLTKSGFTVERNGRRTLRDFPRNRLLRWMRDDAAASSEPLEAEVEPRLLELRTAAALNRLRAEKEENPVDLPIAVETRTGLESEEGALRGAFAFQETKEGFVVTVDGSEVVRVAWDARPLDGAWGPAWRRFLARETRLHPVVRTRVMDENRLPAELTYRWYQDGVRTRTTLRIVKVEDGTASLPVPPAAVAHGDDALGRALAAAAAAKAPGKAASVAKAAQLKREGGVLDGFLALLAYSLATGDAAERELDAYLESAVARHEVKEFMELVRGAGDPAKAAAARDALAALHGGNLRYAWVAGVHRAGACRTLGDDASAREILLGILAEHPEAASAWIELGWVSASMSAFGDAWRCWDAAYRLAPYHPMSLEVVKRREALRRDGAAFFR